MSQINSVHNLTPDWNSNKDFSDNASKAWRDFYFGYPYFNERKICHYWDGEISPLFQTLGHGDTVIIIGDSYRPIFTIEQKTRTEAIYKNYFKKDHMILFEVMSNIQRNTVGSTPFTSKADLLAYGFMIKDRIVEGRIYERQPLIDFLEMSKEKYQTKTSNTNGLYSTQNIIVPEWQIKKFELV